MRVGTHGVVYERVRRELGAPELERPGFPRLHQAPADPVPPVLGYHVPSLEKSNRARLATLGVKSARYLGKPDEPGRLRSGVHGDEHSLGHHTRLTPLLIEEAACIRSEGSRLHVGPQRVSQVGPLRGIGEPDRTDGDRGL